MNVLVVLGHPAAGSLNHGIAAAAVEALQGAGHRVRFHDLYREGFDPCLTAAEIPSDGAVPEKVREHCDALAAADGLVVVHPNWWGQPPALVKGWVDRVFRPGVAYRFLEGDAGEGTPLGLLKLRAALVFNTCNTPERRERSAFGDPLETLWRRCVFGLCGVATVERRMFGVVVTSTPEERRAWLAEVKDTVLRHFPPEPAPGPAAPR